jgi:hypothetical protein
LGHAGNTSKFAVAGRYRIRPGEAITSGFYEHHAIIAAALPASLQRPRAAWMPTTSLQGSIYGVSQQARLQSGELRTQNAAEQIFNNRSGFDIRNHKLLHFRDIVR